MFTNVPNDTIRRRCLGLVFCSLLFLPLAPAMLIRSLYLLAKVRSWNDLGLSLLRLFLSPIFALLLLFAATYGIFRPQQGRSVYGTLERLFFPHGLCPAICFLPTRFRFESMAKYLLANYANMTKEEGFINAKFFFKSKDFLKSTAPSGNMV
jgi:hypothetical protein